MATATREVTPMTDSEFRMFCELIRNHCGLHFGPESRFLLEKRIARRMNELAIGSFAAYHYLLRSERDGGQEMANAVDELTTNETYFFRELSPLRALVNEIVPEFRARSNRPVSIWSAGCSSGEEPYSVLMLAREAGLEPGKDIHVYASDISRRVLGKARRGVYREASFRDTDSYYRQKYFVEKDGSWTIRDEVKRHVDFIHLNLVERGKIAILGTMDVILCRNVIIYFDTDTKRRVVQTYHEKLVPGGYLLMGHAESLLNLSNDFELRHLRNDMVYRKPTPGELPTERWHAAAAAAIARVERGERGERGGES
jgi:chemotaxis protein methyltransferase CheR